MHRRLRSLLQVILVSISTASVGQSGGGVYHDTSRIGFEDATCLVKNNPVLIEAWLSTLPGSTEERSFGQKIDVVFPGCISRTALLRDAEFHFDPTTLRPVIIVTILNREFRELPEQTPAGLDQPHWYKEPSVADRASAIAEIQSNFGYCVAKTDWAGTLAFITASPGSAPENAALNRLAPLFGGCIPGQIKMTISRPVLRNVLEETVYHVLWASRAPPPRG